MLLIKNNYSTMGRSYTLMYNTSDLKKELNLISKISKVNLTPRVKFKGK